MPFLDISFDNKFLQKLPVDQEQHNYCRQVEGAASSLVKPKTTANPKVVAVSQDLAEQLALDNQALYSEEFAQVFTGNTLLSGMQPYAMCYGGHQFGHWAGQLGDGRAINLGQMYNTQQELVTLQLKGAGQTPYSRNADGLAVLRSSIREYLCSEAMFHLGIPTTRALSLCLTGNLVTRDMFYDGNAKQELGAVVCRVSASFVRFGSFQLPAARGDIKLLKQLVDYTIETNFPHLGQPSKAVYLAWFKEVSERTCHLIVDWLRVGFVHGVMNTDNMSIIGETIDYGPYGWIDNFDLNWTPNTTDAQGKRYCFGAQPEIAQWNLFQLANAIYPLIEDAEPLNKILNDYAHLHQTLWLKMMREKLGFDVHVFNEEIEAIEEVDGEQAAKNNQQHNDETLILQLESLMSQGEIDMTIFYRLLASFLDQQQPWQQFFKPCFYEDHEFSETFVDQFEQWLIQYKRRIAKNNNSDTERKKSMNAVNPKYVLRNYLAQQAIEKAEQGDYSMIKQLETALKRPYDEQPEFESFFQKRPQWAKNKAGCSMLSCSS